ncbi:DUF6328 family protein [Nocardia sp. CDC153]|uniref:DUF6328 family protein n=1 Tax=Nocardia sp. CDC153 TaxID=3112167 RepID=UPI002DB8DAA6|nr:DUF6328 family protein [Nocardia sp. CDC153]MEC3957487.1 DUF6328 family protein [Nocardia sp. CDC153]
MPAAEQTSTSRQTSAPTLDDGRDETNTERLDRNWNSLMQELRVVQTGVQLLTGFLLTLPFQNRFTVLPPPMKWLYLGIVAASIGATVCLIAPVAAHRMLFRRHRIDQVVTAAHRYALAGLGLLGLALTGVAILIFDTVAGVVAAIVVGGVVACLFVWVWLVHPWRQRSGERF